MANEPPRWRRAPGLRRDLPSIVRSDASHQNVGVGQQLDYQAAFSMQRKMQAQSQLMSTRKDTRAYILKTPAGCAISAAQAAASLLGLADELVAHRSHLPPCLSQ